MTSTIQYSYTLYYCFSCAELYMIQDESDGFADTWRFLDHQLQGVHHVSCKPPPRPSSSLPSDVTVSPN